jgi:hypothetical protein
VTLALLAAVALADAKSKAFTGAFMIERCDFASEGTNPYFPLERRSKSVKAFAPGIGLIQDDDLLLESVSTVP